MAHVVARWFAVVRGFAPGSVDAGSGGGLLW
jgi:hypothetical protein